MKKTMIVLLAVFTLLFSAMAQAQVDSGNQSIGIFDNHGDFFYADMEGSASFDPQTGVYEVIGTGEVHEDNSTGDFGHFLYKEITGDFRLKAKVVSGGPRAGWIFCIDDLELHPSAFYMAWVESENSVASDRIGVIAPYWQATYGGGRSHTSISDWIRPDAHDFRAEVVREGNLFSLYYYDLNEEDWTLLDSREIEVTDPVYVGLASWSGDYTQYNTTHFSEVELVVGTSSSVEGWELYSYR